MSKHSSSQNTFRSPRIGLYFDWRANRALDGIFAFAQEQNWHLLFDGAFDSHWSRPVVALDGIICSIGPGEKVAQLIARQSVPTVQVFEEDGGLGAGCHRVHPDNKAIGRMAAHFFREKGYERVVVISKQIPLAFSTRTNSFLHYSVESGMKATSLVLKSSTIDSLAAKELTKLIEPSQFPLGIYVTSDIVAVQVMYFLIERGVLIPEQVAILGTDNVPMVCERAPIPLSSIRINSFTIGYEACKMLHGVMQRRPAQVQVRQYEPRGIEERQSTNTIAVRSDHVARALRFIWQNYSRDLPLEEISEHVGIKQNTLSILFRKHLRRTVVDEIKRMRVGKAKEMLLAPGARVTQVSEACGFGSPNYFHRVFLASTGQSPAAYRKANIPNPRKESPKVFQNRL